MFDFKEFLMSCLIDGVEHGETRHDIGLEAAEWNYRGTLKLQDIEALDTALKERDAPPEVPFEDMTQDMVE